MKFRTRLAEKALPNYTTKTMRGPNSVVADAETLASKDGLRRASGKNVKRALPDRRFDIVRIWTLKERVNGAWVVKRNYATTAEAQEWVGV